MFKVSVLFLRILTLTVASANAQVYGGFPQRSSPSALPSSSTQITPLPGVPAPAAPVTAQPSMPTFSDRVTQCMQAAGASGYGAGDVAGYTRACANNP